MRRLPPNEGIIEGYLLRNCYFTTISSSSLRMVANTHRLAAYFLTTLPDVTAIQHRWPWTTLKSKNSGFLVIFSDFRLCCTLSEFSPKLLEIDQDNLHMKLNWCCRAFCQHWLIFLVISIPFSVLYCCAFWCLKNSCTVNFVQKYIAKLCVSLIGTPSGGLESTLNG